MSCCGDNGGSVSGTVVRCGVCVCLCMLVCVCACAGVCVCSNCCGMALGSIFDDSCTLLGASSLKISYKLRPIKNAKLSSNLSSRRLTCVTI